MQNQAPGVPVWQCNKVLSDKTFQQITKVTTALHVAPINCARITWQTTQSHLQNSDLYTAALSSIITELENVYSLKTFEGIKDYYFNPII